MNKNLVFIIKANQEFIRHSKKEIVEVEAELNSLFESVSHTYIPLLNMLERFEAEGIKAKIGLVLPPVLCALLDNPEIQNMYSLWLDNRIALGEKELKRAKKNPEILKNVERIIAENKQIKKDFQEKYSKKLIEKFVEYHRKDYIELIATCGTDIFMPHYSDMPEVLSAQIEVGLQAYRKSFGETPEGFWIPELGYTPEVENIIKAYGYSYTVVDSRSILLSKTLPSKGIFYPMRTENSLAVFSNNPFFNDELFGEDGFADNEVYCNVNHDIGFDLSMDELSPVVKKGECRLSTGFCYWNKSFDEKSIYDSEKAFEQAKLDAESFLKTNSELLTKAGDEIKDTDFVCLVCTVDAEKLRVDWAEGLYWLEQVIRGSSEYSLNVTTCNQMTQKPFTYEKVVPYYSSAAGTGYGENLLSSKNCWMMRYIKKACERMIDLSDRFPNDTGLKTRLLNLGAKELIIAQSSGLAKMIENDDFPEFAKNRFMDSIKAFTSVFDSLGSNTVSTEWLTTLEIYDDIFPWLNYRIFSKKK